MLHRTFVHYISFSLFSVHIRDSTLSYVPPLNATVHHPALTDASRAIIARMTISFIPIYSHFAFSFHISDYISHDQTDEARSFFGPLS